MTIHCINCGTELPDGAKFCLTCGKPPRGALASSTISNPEIEYTEIFLDRSVRPIYDKWDKRSPRLDSPDMAIAARNRRVYEELKPLLAQGWVMDGPFDTAVRIRYETKRQWFAPRTTTREGWTTGCWIKLKRVVS